MKKIIAVIDIDGVITNLDFMIFKNISSKIINIGHHIVNNLLTSVQKSFRHLSFYIH